MLEKLARFSLKNTVLGTHFYQYLAKLDNIPFSVVSWSFLLHLRNNSKQCARRIINDMLHTRDEVSKQAITIFTYVQYLARFYLEEISGK
jgi:hypothetical protein